MRHFPLLLAPALVSGHSLLFAQAGIHYQQDFPPAEFRARWNQMLDKIGPEAVAVVQGAALANGFSLPRQNNEFYYLCGVETPHSYLLLDGRSRKVMLYLPPRNARLEASEGKVLSAEDAELALTLTGADQVLSTDAMRNGDWLGSLSGGAPPLIYALFSPGEGNTQNRNELQASNAAIAADYWDGRLPREAQFTGLLRARYPRAQVADLTPVLDAMRSVKSPREIALIRRASQIAGQGILEAMKSTRAGLREYQLDAAARYVFLVNGARLEGYRSITASGTANIWNAHYYRNRDELRSGDLILQDFAPEYGYYTSDVTRMWPVNGKFSPVQRELLGFVLEYRDAIIGRIRPGKTRVEIMAEAEAAMAPVIARTRFSKPAYEQAARELITKGGGVFSHPVGMAVHDDGPYGNAPLRPGHVFSIDPQLRVPDERLYIRYEDVVVVTETGVENFTDFLVSDLDEIERVMKESAASNSGIVQRFPPGGPKFRR
ncbi:MAG: aminopeptidase P N-terminal domain-containing protein [Bryobacteraceae bacterium]